MLNMQPPGSSVCVFGETQMQPVVKQKVTSWDLFVPDVLKYVWLIYFAAC